MIARGVYPAVLRDQGPAAALDEVAADLPRPVRLTGGLGGRLDWEIESGIYYVVAAAISVLAGRPAEAELLVHFERADGRVQVRIDDPAPDRSRPSSCATALADEVERLAALGGDLELSGPAAGGPDGRRPVDRERAGLAAGPARAAGREQRRRGAEGAVTAGRGDRRGRPARAPPRRLARYRLRGAAGCCAPCCRSPGWWSAPWSPRPPGCRRSTAELDAAAAAGSRWAGAVLAAVPTSEPLGPAGARLRLQPDLDRLAVALLTLRERTWSIRLFALAMIGSAGAFNLQAHAAATAVETASGPTIGPLHQVLLPGVACAAYILALTVFPTAGEPARAGLARTRAGRGRAAGTLLLVGSGTALLPQATSCVLFFGFLVPLAGLTALPGNIRHARLAVVRTQSRLLFSVLAGAFAVDRRARPDHHAALWPSAGPAPTLVDPTARTPGAGGPADRPAVLVLPAGLRRDRRCGTGGHPPWRLMDRRAPVQPRSGGRAGRRDGRRRAHRAAHAGRAS